MYPDKSTGVSCMVDIRRDIHMLEEGITTGGKEATSDLCQYFYILPSAIFVTFFKRKQHKFPMKCLLLNCELGWSLHWTSELWAGLLEICQMTKCPWNESKKLY